MIASAATILVADLAPEGAEHIKELLAGSIIWVTWSTVLRELFLVSLVGIVLFFFRRTFTLISTHPQEAFDQGMAVRWWDFLFYLCFGLVITVAVEVAGVLMVFSYLVAPAIIAVTLSHQWRHRVLIAWGVGSLASGLGLFSSYRWDLPAGPAIVCALGLLLVLFALWRTLARRFEASSEGR